MMIDKKILVCEDDPGVSELIRTILEENKYQVEILNNGKGILKKVKEYLPDLIMLDLWMPGIKGDEIVKILKSDSHVQNIPIIIISALNEAGKISDHCGADGFIAKPFDVDTLLRLVKEYIRH